MQLNIDLSKPVAFDKLISQSISIYKNNFKFIIIVIGIFFLPLILFPLIFGDVYDSFFKTAMMSQGVPPDEETVKQFFSAWLRLFGFGMIAMVFWYLSGPAVVKAFHDLFNDKEENIGEVVKYTLFKSFHLVVTGAIVLLMFFVGWMFCFIPGLILIIYAMYVTQINIIEDRFYFGSIARSFSITSGYFWSTLLVPLIFYLAVSTLTGIIQIAVMGDLFFKIALNPGQVPDMSIFENFKLRFIIYSVVVNGLLTFVMPVLHIALSLKFLNLRKIKEGAEVVS